MYLLRYIPMIEAFGWSGGPEFHTRNIEMRNGRERRNAEWAEARHKYRLQFKSILSGQYPKIKTHHVICRGRLHCFLYQDHLDHAADDAVFAVADPGQTTFQLGKWSELDGVSYFRSVDCLYRPDYNNLGQPIEVVPTIRVNGTPDVTAVVDPNTGLVTTTPMSGGEILSWDGQFSMWVRFDNDWLDWSIVNKTDDGQFITDGSVDIIQMPPPAHGEMSS